ncbi:hypothetical protein AVEN_32959-1 [Araneus ventricosus]|uniref:Uncharacterized protein n=1 Tax=Araneus ventricosus TaxID=182803 RepID=A0A4Y2INW9_ARAVE|nr:hypothetical protein AVEN_32959-1 [Araneus ventricosus]
MALAPLNPNQPTNRGTGCLHAHNSSRSCLHNLKVLALHRVVAHRVSSKAFLSHSSGGFPSKQQWRLSFPNSSGGSPFKQQWRLRFPSRAPLVSPNSRRPHAFQTALLVFQSTGSKQAFPHSLQRVTHRVGIQQRCHQLNML